MLKIITGSHQIELTTGNRYEAESVPKYFMKFSDHVIATFYRSGIIKSVGDVELATMRTLGGSYVAMETDVRTGGYTTMCTTQAQMVQFADTLTDLLAVRKAVLAGEKIVVQRFEQFEYEPDVPTDEELLTFFRNVKGPSELDSLAKRLNSRLGLIDVLHPTIGDLDYLVFSVAQGCDGGCRKCSFQHRRSLTPRTEEDVKSQIGLYNEIFSQKERSRFEIFAGNHRGMGIDFELFCRYIGMIRRGAGMSDGRVFVFCIADDIVRLHDRYGALEMERRMLEMGVHLNFGVESGSCKGLQEYGKKTTLATMRKALMILKCTKIPHSVNILAGVEWESHSWATIKLFRGLYRPGDNRPAVYSSDFIGDDSYVDRKLSAQQYKMFRNALNDCGIYVYRYNFVPFNN